MVSCCTPRRNHIFAGGFDNVVDDKMYVCETCVEMPLGPISRDQSSREKERERERDGNSYYVLSLNAAMNIIVNSPRIECLGPFHARGGRCRWCQQRRNGLLKGMGRQEKKWGGGGSLSLWFPFPHSLDPIGFWNLEAGMRDSASREAKKKREISGVAAGNKGDEGRRTHLEGPLSFGKEAAEACFPLLLLLPPEN